MYFFSWNKKPSPSNSAPANRPRVASSSSPYRPRMRSATLTPPRSHASVYPWSAHVPPSRSSLSPLPRHAHTLSTIATVAGELFLFGGCVPSSDSASNDLYTFSTRDFSMTLLKTSGKTPDPRYGHRAAFTSTTLLIWGGVTNHSDQNEENQCDDDSLYYLNLVSREWTRVVVNGPGPGSRCHHTMTLVGPKLFVFGGQNAGRNFNDVWAFDLNRLTSRPFWESYEPTLRNEKPPPRAGHVSVTIGDRIIIFGGVAERYYNDTWSFDTSTRKWTELRCTGSIPSPRSSHAAVLVDDIMYVFGGRAPDGTKLGDLTALNLLTQRWFVFQDIGSDPRGRSSHAMASDGKRVFLLGGVLPADAKANESELIYVLHTERIKYPDPDPDTVNLSEKATQLARDSSESASPSAQGRPQQPTFSSSDSDVHAEHSTSPFQRATPGDSDHPASLQIARFRMNDKPIHVSEGEDDSEGSTEHHAGFVAVDASEKEVARLEQERYANLERQLSETLAAQTERDRRIAQLSEQLAQKSALLEQAEANAAEAKKHPGLEVREAELDESMLFRGDHSLTLEQAQSALQQATSHVADTDKRRQSLNQSAREHETELTEVRAELEGKKSELEAVRLQLTDAEDRCAKSKEEAETLRVQTAASLINADVDRVMHRLMERIRAMEAEMESMRGNEKSIESMECRNEG